MTCSSPKPAILLIQGSFQLPEVYGKLVRALIAKGYPVIHPPLPSLTGHERPDFASTSLSDDANVIQDELRRLVEQERKQVVILMHSYGGLVGIEATPEEFSWAKRREQGLAGGVLRLILLAAFVLSEGQSVMGTFGKSPNHEIQPDGRFHIKEAARRLYNDLPSEEAQYWESKIIDQAYAVQTTKLTRAAYRYIPSTYIVCEDDQAVPPVFQEQFGGSINATVLKIKSGHSPMLSQTEKLVEMVISAI
ncbi:catalytic protein [Hypoxylon fuscum]|nr:catalytic protein [Hypoxylon fuscum]